MKFSRIILFSTLIMITGLFCSCKKTESIEFSDELQIKPIGPVTEITVERLIDGTQSLCNAVQDSYSKMLELASAEDASEKGKKAAVEVQEKYGERIKELSEMDFSGLSESELEDYMHELSDLITVIREARDALTL